MYRHKQKHSQVEPEQLDRWLVSYADYMTLMFALFVVLYAMAIVKEEQYSVLADSLTRMFEKPEQSGTGVPGQSVLTTPAQQSELDLYGTSLEQPKGPELVADATRLSDVSQRLLGSPLQSVEQQLTKALANLLEQGLAKLQQDQNWLTIELSSGLLFASGSATATPSAKTLLTEITRVINPINNFIRVRGYTDDQPINNELFSSNWELSAWRALAVLRQLQQQLQPPRLAMEAYAAYRPVSDNGDEQSRARNRRVVITVSKYAWQPPTAAAANETATTAATVSPAVSAAAGQPQRAEPQAEAELDNGLKLIRLPNGGIRITNGEE